MQFLLLAYDGRDDDAKARRAAARPAHFAGIKPMVEQGELRAAGAILDDIGDMIGSVVFAEFPSRAELDAWLAREPYVKEGVALRKRGCAWVADVADMYPACEMSERLLKLLRKFQDFQSEHAVDTTSPLQIVTASECRDRWLRVRDFEPVAHSGPAELADACQPRSVGASPVGPRRLLPFSLRTPQRNRNELGETTVNKTWRKHMPQQ